METQADIIKAMFKAELVASGIPAKDVDDIIKMLNNKHEKPDEK